MSAVLRPKTVSDAFVVYLSIPDYTFREFLKRSPKSLEGSWIFEQKDRWSKAIALVNPEKPEIQIIGHPRVFPRLGIEVPGKIPMRQNTEFFRTFKGVLIISILFSIAVSASMGICLLVTKRIDTILLVGLVGGLMALLLSVRLSRFFQSTAMKQAGVSGSLSMGILLLILLSRGWLL